LGPLVTSLKMSGFGFTLWRLPSKNKRSAEQRGGVGFGIDPWRLWLGGSRSNSLFVRGQLVNGDEYCTAWKGTALERAIHDKVAQLIKARLIKPNWVLKQISQNLMCLKTYHVWLHMFKYMLCLLTDVFKHTVSFMLKHFVL
jgi:hypothetical protein